MTARWRSSKALQQHDTTPQDRHAPYLLYNAETMLGSVVRKLSSPVGNVTVKFVKLGCGSALALATNRVNTRMRTNLREV